MLFWCLIKTDGSKTQNFTNYVRGTKAVSITGYNSNSAIDTGIDIPSNAYDIIVFVTRGYTNNNQNPRAVFKLIDGDLFMYVTEQYNWASGSIEIAYSYKY